MVTFDISSLFTNLPLNETIELAVDCILSNNPNITMSRQQLKKLFHFATSMSHFIFNGNYYQQVDGVGMGSPLASALANLFLSHSEEKWIDNCTTSRPTFYRRYVDDIFCVFDNADEAKSFLITSIVGIEI